jgi:hypothetical protein
VIAALLASLPGSWRRSFLVLLFERFCVAVNIAFGIAVFPLFQIAAPAFAATRLLTAAAAAGFLFPVIRALVMRPRLFCALVGLSPRSLFLSSGI